MKIYFFAFIVMVSLFGKTNAESSLRGSNNGTDIANDIGSLNGNEDSADTESFLYDNGTIIEGILLSDVSEDSAIEISSYMLTFIKDDGIDNTDIIYDLLESINSDFTVDFIEDVMEMYPQHFLSVKEVYEQYESEKDSKGVEEMVKALTNALETEAHSSGSIDKALESLGMSIEEVEEFFDAYGHQELADTVIDAYEASEEKTRIGLASVLSDTGSFHFKEDGTARHLSTSLGDQIDAIHNEERRALSMEKSLATKTRDFQARLNSHVEDVDRHMKKLSNRRLESFRQMESKMADINERVNTALSPVISLFDKLATAQDTLTSGKTTTNVIHVTLVAATKIPKIGPVFGAPEKAFKVINEQTKNAHAKLTSFETKVMKVWDNTIGRVIEAMDDFETNLGRAAFVKETVDDISKSQCMANIVEGIVGFPFVQEALSVAQVIENHATTFIDVLEYLVHALAKGAWTTTQKVLNTIVDICEGALGAFTRPFEPLAKLMQKEISIPFFKIPYTKKNLGPAKCKSSGAVGYPSHLGVFKHTCYEMKNPKYFKTVPLAIPPKFKVTCAYGNMATNTFGKCRGHHFGRQQKPLTCFKKCSKKFGSKWYRSGCGRCKLKCCGSSCYPGKSDFTTETLHYCYKKTCPSGFNTERNGKLCGRKTVNKRKHTAVCSSYPECNQGGGCLLPATGGCFNQCKPGDKVFGALCFPEATLKISVQGIFDAFSEILEFISELPIVDIILDAIDKVVSPILKPVTSIIDNWLANLGISIPDFDDIAEGLLPFGDINDILGDVLPPLPSIDSIMGIVEEQVDKAAKNLGLNDLAALQSCVTDMECLQEQLGLSSVPLPTDLLLD